MNENNSRLNTKSPSLGNEPKSKLPPGVETATKLMPSCGGWGHRLGEGCADCRDFVQSVVLEEFTKIQLDYVGAPLNDTTVTAIEMRCRHLEQKLYALGYDYEILLRWEDRHAVLDYKPRQRKKLKFEDFYLGRWEPERWAETASLAIDTYDVLAERNEDPACPQRPRYGGVPFHAIWKLVAGVYFPVAVRQGFKGGMLDWHQAMKDARPHDRAANAKRDRELGLKPEYQWREA